MEDISQKHVEKICREIAGFSPDRAGREMRKMAEAHPELLAFLMTMTEDLEPEVSELGIYMAFVVYRIFHSQGPRRMTLTSQEIIDCFESNESQMGSLEGALESFIEKIPGVHGTTQPYVMKYVMETLDQEGEGDIGGMTDEDRVFLFLLLKTEVDLLDRKEG